ncbi:MAG TPA: Flp family type IVb pilin [Firmicutes bacterium]|nr:Flp family type IVb pilin [Candidatus Fermentithermobacillaceae bacterium]
MMRFFERLYKEEEGQGLVEYALIIALIAVALIVAIKPLREAIAAVFNDISTKLTEGTGDGGES